MPTGAITPAGHSEPPSRKPPLNTSAKNEQVAALVTPYDTSLPRRGPQSPARVFFEEPMEKHCLFYWQLMPE